MTKSEQTPVIYRGEYLGKRHTIEEMIKACLESEEEIVLADPATYRITFTVSDGAAEARLILEEGGPLIDCWRFGILQTIDSYKSVRKYAGVEGAKRVFETEPPSSGSIHVDAALAALCDHLSQEDGWECPAWALDPARVSPGWLPAELEAFWPMALEESPEAFRKRGVWIGENCLNRV